MTTAFAGWLEQQIRARGWETLREAGDALGVGHSSLSRYLSGQQGPSRQNLKRIVAALGADRDAVEALLAEADRAVVAGGVPRELATAAAPVRGFSEALWERLSPAARERIIESARIDLEEAGEPR